MARPGPYERVGRIGASAGAASPPASAGDRVRSTSRITRLDRDDRDERDADEPATPTGSIELAMTARNAAVPKRPDRIPRWTAIPCEVPPARPRAEDHLDLRMVEVRQRLEP